MASMPHGRSSKGGGRLAAGRCPQHTKHLAHKQADLVVCLLPEQTRCNSDTARTVGVLQTGHSENKSFAAPPKRPQTLQRKALFVHQADANFLCFLTHNLRPPRDACLMCRVFASLPRTSIRVDFGRPLAPRSNKHQPLHRHAPICEKRPSNTRRHALISRHPAGNELRGRIPYRLHPKLALLVAVHVHYAPRFD